MQKDKIITWPTAFLLCIASTIVGCRAAPEPAPQTLSQITETHAATRAIDRIEKDLSLATSDLMRMSLHAQRWPLVQQAVAYQGITHRDAFFGSRSYWHTGSTRGIGWALDQPGKLDEAFYIATKGNVRISGDVNADIEIAGNSIVHILGDLDATLDLQGICEVIIAGNLTENATIICDGQLQLFVGGNSQGILGSTKSSTIVIDGNASGTIQSGAPATVLTVTGDLAADIPPPKNKDTILTLRVDGYTPSAKIQALANAGFTRINATLGTSDTPPGLYPQNETTTRPTARWVVLKQREPSN
ncbi:MAG: polymer-forming cytoskeletal protein [Phycisphaeraceae bacterium]